MNAYDPQKAARVWQRVQGQQNTNQPEQPGGCQELVMNELTMAAACQRLARGIKGKEAVLQRLVREERSHAACLKGIHCLMTGQRPDPAVPEAAPEPAERLLRRCYGQVLRNLKTYEARAEDAEYGPVFAGLVRQEREHCRVLLELLGELGKD